MVVGSIRNEVLSYVKTKFNTLPEYPWAKTPDTAVLRHSENKKWYGIIMDIKKNRLGIESEEMIDILNLKCDPVLISSLLDNKGFYPAYHMNKYHWISIALDNSVDLDEIKRLIKLSYQLTV